MTNLSAGGAEREADEIMDAVCDGRIPTRAELKTKVRALLARCANEARLEALEQAAAKMGEYCCGCCCADERCSGEFDPVEAIRALKAAPLDPPGGQHEN